MLPKIKHPLHKIELPSDGRAVSCTPFRGREEKMLLIAKQSGDPRDALAAVKQVVNNCVVETGFDVDEITIFDLEWLFLQIRRVSVDNMTKVNLIDSQDKKTYTFDVKLDDVKVHKPDAAPNVIDLGDGVALQLRWPPAKLYTDSDVLAADGPEAFDLIASKCVDKVFQGDDVTEGSQCSAEELLTFIEDLDMKTREKLREFLASAPRLSYTIDYKNEAGLERTFELTTLSDFFSFS